MAASNTVHAANDAASTSNGLTNTSVSAPIASNVVTGEEGDYRVQGKLGEGTFSQVLRMRNRVSGKISAMKRFKKKFKSIEEVECLREIQALRRVNPHPNMVSLEDVLFDPGSGTLYLAFELMDCNLYDMISKRLTTSSESKTRLWFYQICKALEFLHSKSIFHRDIKPENILIKDGVVVKIADFGSCRGIHSKGPFTEYIATRWYRSPETLLTSGIYNYKMDIWGAGCVLYEIITRQPLFPGSDALDQLHRIHGVLGSPTDQQLRGVLGPKMEGKVAFPTVRGRGITLPQPYNTQCYSLMMSMLAYAPEERVTGSQALAHPWLKGTDFSELPLNMHLYYRDQAAVVAAATAVVAAAASANALMKAGAVAAVVTTTSSNDQSFSKADGKQQQQQQLPPTDGLVASSVAPAEHHQALSGVDQQQPEGYFSRLLKNRTTHEVGSSNAVVASTNVKTNVLPTIATTHRLPHNSHHLGPRHGQGFSSQDLYKPGNPQRSSQLGVDPSHTEVGNHRVLTRKLTDAAIPLPPLAPATRIAVGNVQNGPTLGVRGLGGAANNGAAHRMGNHNNENASYAALHAAGAGANGISNAPPISHPKNHHIIGGQADGSVPTKTSHRQGPHGNVVAPGRHK